MQRNQNNEKRRGPENALGTAKRLIGEIAGKYRAHLIAVFAGILVSAGASVLGSTFLQTLIDDYIAPLIGSANPAYGALLGAIVMMGGIYLVGILATFLYNRLMVSVSQGTLKNMRDRMFGHMESLPVRYFDQNQVGDIMSRYTNDIDTLRQMISQSLPQLISSLITIVFVLCAMLSMSWVLTLVVLVMMVVIWKVSGYVTGKSATHFKRQQKAIGAVNGYVEELIGGQKVVKVFGYEDRAVTQFGALNDELASSATQANTYGNILMPLLGNLGYLQYVLIAIVGGALAFSGAGSGLTLGAIASFLLLSRSMSMPISQIAQQINSVIMALAGAERIFNLLDEQPEEDGGYVTLVNAERAADGTLREARERTGLWAWKHPHGDGSVTYTELRGDVRFEHVDFGYTDEKQVLRDITLFAKPGQKVALVGATGAGKTTITNLLNRFYDISAGKIRYDGINIQKIKKPDLRRSLGIVLQDTHLFTGTVMDNIRYGKPDAADEEVIAAAKLVNAHGFISRLPSGYQTVIAGDGAGLSQGQKQLISIARAAAADPPVMILDEATSSIDTRTEAIVQRGMDALMKGRTVFVIAHRLSTIQNADVILVMDGGQIIERGNHEELLAERGAYYQLYTGGLDAA